MSAETVIKVKNLSCLSGSQFLLYNINWEIKKGEQWVVFGRNGCGKTTLLSIIAGYKSFSSGELEVFGQTYDASNILDIRKRIGWISSSFFDKYYHGERVLDIVLASLTGALGMPLEVENAQLAKAKQLLTQLGLRDKIDNTFDMLSKGERQHVLIARAFMTDPEILILDEPGNGLDVLARERLLATIQTLAAGRDTTIIYVTHYPEEILPSFDKSLLLRNGAVYQTGTTQELFTTEVMSDFLNHAIHVEYTGERYNFSLPSDAQGMFAEAYPVEGSV
jgi:iron complex transport system ATP-binding protein